MLDHQRVEEPPCLRLLAVGTVNDCCTHGHTFFLGEVRSQVRRPAPCGSCPIDRTIRLPYNMIVRYPYNHVKRYSSEPRPVRRRAAATLLAMGPRSEERRVGKEC